MRANHVISRALVGSIFLVLGFGLISAGYVQLSIIASAYQTSDLLRTETPSSFRAWLVRLKKESDMPAGGQADAIAQRVAYRLMIMPRPARHRLIISMARPDFWSDVFPAQAEQNSVMEGVLNGVYLVLGNEPGAGDLYFCVALLESSLHGYTEIARRSLAASNTFSPRELDIAIERLVLSPNIWGSLTEQEKASLRRDLEYVIQAYPNRKTQIITELNEQGVSLE